MGNRRKRLGGGGALLTIIILIATKDLWMPILGWLLGIFGSILAFFVVLALIIFAIVKTSEKKKKNSYGQTGQQYSQQTNKQNKNPYSSQYGPTASSTAYKDDVVIDGSTVKVAPADAETQQKQETPSVQPRKEEFKSTGDPEIDKMIMDKEQAIKEMKRLDEGIDDEKLSSQIVHLEDVTERIVDYIVEHPNKKNEVSKFFSYYLPTTLKLLDAYDRMDDTGISGENIDTTKKKVEDMMDMALSAFDKQLDALFGDEALDVTTDIKVMENMLKAEGLTDDGITLKL